MNNTATLSNPHTDAMRDNVTYRVAVEAYHALASELDAFHDGAISRPEHVIRREFEAAQANFYRVQKALGL